MRSFITILLVLLVGIGLFLAGCNSAGSSVYKLKATNLNQKGQVYFNYGQYNEAIVSYQESLDIDFENSATHYWLGRAYQETADPQKAIEEYRLAVRFTPSLEVSQVALITTLHDVGQLDESIIATKDFVKYRTGQANDMIRIGQHF
ncbi:MAG: tetratricopeptide repeat protein, partial [Planctomycetes bacterium]|nr:tetratricopeptide repeat protein [Planctomycetota bacterium]